MGLKRAKISSVGRYVPDHVLTNTDLEKMVDTNDEWIKTRTGIKERRILKDPDKATAYMSAQAAKEALAAANVDAKDVDVIIVATITPDFLFPATACLVQGEIGADQAWAFDLSAACSGFVYGISTGSMMIESGRAERVLVIGADKMSSIIDYTDRTTCILFGDAAGAVLLEPSEDEDGIHDFVHHSSADDAC
jgi:3-oxoacyl-[acyl-carrier-protein] synthase III